MSKVAERTCLGCGNCDYIGEGDHICDCDPTKIVVADWLPTDDYFWCGGAKYE